MKRIEKIQLVAAKIASEPGVTISAESITKSLTNIAKAYKLDLNGESKSDEIAEELVREYTAMFQYLSQAENANKGGDDLVSSSKNNERK